MTRTPFGRTGLHVSPLGFGTAPIGFIKTEQETVGRILNTLLDAGVNLIDTAASYQGSEEVIGATVGHRRSEFVLVSKCGSKVPQADGAPWSAELVRNTVDAALRRLQTDVIDVMLLHSCDLATLQKGEALGALVDARNAGKIRHAGYSGDNDAAAWAAAHPDVAVIETSVSFVDQANVDAVLPVARMKNVGVLAKRPIGNSCWRELSEFQAFYPEYVRPYRERLEKMGITSASVGFAGDWPELALRFTLSQAGVHTAIIGTTNPDNARANIELAKKGPLPAEVGEKIRQAFARAGGGKWPGLQ
ncbi:MAG TPA: aldo/keto reductase [Tepidisphaeraceae bacterium]|nr:aldo/keto reductase [Tepidisphaeraceae bacterium]